MIGNNQPQCPKDLKNHWVHVLERETALWLVVLGHWQALCSLFHTQTPWSNKRLRRPNLLTQGSPSSDFMKKIWIRKTVCYNVFYEGEARGNNLNVQQTRENEVDDDTSAKWNFTEAWKVIVPFTLVPRIMKHLGKNEHVQYLCAENDRLLRNERKKELNKWRRAVFKDQRTQHSKDFNSPKIDLYV